LILFTRLDAKEPGEVSSHHNSSVPSFRGGLFFSDGGRRVRSREHALPVPEQSVRKNGQLVRTSASIALVFQQMLRDPPI
jgi:hypothetical protein